MWLQVFQELSFEIKLFVYKRKLALFDHPCIKNYKKVCSTEKVLVACYRALKFQPPPNGDITGNSLLKFSPNISSLSDKNFRIFPDMELVRIRLLFTQFCGRHFCLTNWMADPSVRRNCQSRIVLRANRTIWWITSHLTLMVTTTKHIFIVLTLTPTDGELAPKARKKAKTQKLPVVIIDEAEQKWRFEKHSKANTLQGKRQLAVLKPENRFEERPTKTVCDCGAVATLVQPEKLFL